MQSTPGSSNRAGRTKWPSSAPLLITLLLWLLSPASASAEPLTADPEEARATAARILDAGYQTELTPSGKTDAEDPSPLVAFQARGPGWLGWVVLGAAAVAFLVFVIRQGLDARARSDDPVEASPESATHDDEWARHGLRRADELAREKRWNEALHVLLLAAVEEMRRRSRVRIADSLTSREILARVGIPDHARPPLQGLVESVELSFFGARPTSPEDYDRGRGLFERVRRGLSGDSA